MPGFLCLSPGHLPVPLPAPTLAHVIFLCGWRPVFVFLSFLFTLHHKLPLCATLSILFSLLNTPAHPSVAACVSDNPSKPRQTSLTSSDPCPKPIKDKSEGEEVQKIGKTENLTGWRVFFLNSCLPYTLNPFYQNIYSSWADTFLLPSNAIGSCFIYLFTPTNSSPWPPSNKNCICYSCVSTREIWPLPGMNSSALNVFSSVSLRKLCNRGISIACWTSGGGDYGAWRQVPAK